MRRGYTEAPCHGCGSTELHRKDAVCQGCAASLRKHAEHEKWLASHSEKRPFLMPERDYALPYLSHETPAHVHSADRHPIIGPLFKLSMHLSEPTDADAPRAKTGTGPFTEDAWLWKTEGQREWTVTRAIEPAVAYLLRELHDAIRTALKTAHADGVAEGKNLLLSLAGGHLTTDEFNTSAARLTKEATS